MRSPGGEEDESGLCILLCRTNHSSVSPGCWLYRFVLFVSLGLCLIFTGSLSGLLETAKQEEDKEQENANGDRCVGQIEDGEAEADLGNLEEDKIDDVTAMTNSVNQVSRRAADNHAEDKLQRQWPRVEDTQVEISDHSNSDSDEYRQHRRIGEHAEGCPVILNIIQ